MKTNEKAEELKRQAMDLLDEQGRMADALGERARLMRERLSEPEWKALAADVDSRAVEVNEVERLYRRLAEEQARQPPEIKELIVWANRSGLSLGALLERVALGWVRAGLIKE